MRSASQVWKWWYADAYELSITDPHLLSATSSSGLAGPPAPAVPAFPASTFLAAYRPY